MATNPNASKPSARLKKKACYVNLLPPCNNACPAGENIQKWLAHIMEGDTKAAFYELTKNNPFPATMGRVCYHYCEDFCNRMHFDKSVNIHASERFIGDSALQKKWQFAVPEQNSGKKVLIVGSGSAGLSAAYQLRRLGHEVVIYEASKVKGGMLHTAIPAYRLPREVIDSEIARIENMGVEIECEHKVTDILAEKQQCGFDAVFLAVGAGFDKSISLEINELLPMFGAVDFLTQVEFGWKPEIGEHLAIYGGGNTAIDVARCALRLGVKKATIIYRRDREHMPAFDEEIQAAYQERVRFKFFRTIKRINGTELELETMRFDEENHLEQTGKFETFSADALVFALGQKVNLDYLQPVSGIEVVDGELQVQENFMTGCDGVFAGGDVMTHDRSVTKAIGLGKKAAAHINAYLNNTLYDKPAKPELADFSRLHLKDAQNLDRVKQTELPVMQRMDDFREVTLGLTKEQVSYEAARCFSCGNCFECDSCYNVCPVKAITKLGKGERYVIDRDKCIGCSLCFCNCPCGAIEMEED